MTYQGKRIGVTIPAYNEAALIEKTCQGIPKWVDDIAIVDDCSTDGTDSLISAIAMGDRRVMHLSTSANSGVGGAIVVGHAHLIGQECDVLVVMAGDNQMDPEALPLLLDPLISDQADYSKGNRFSSLEFLRGMPRIRVIGNLALSFLSKFATGLWHVSDPQNGYTAIKNSLFSSLPVQRIAKRYNFENDVLCWCRILEARVVDVAIPARYGDEISKLRIPSTSLLIASTLAKSFVLRIWWNYIMWAKSPAAIFLLGTFFFGLPSLCTGAWVFALAIDGTSPSAATALIPVGTGLLAVLSWLTFIVLDVVLSPKPIANRFK